MNRSIYVISGPAGVGKSTTAKRLVERLERSSYISGDLISHLPVNGRGKPWLCEETNRLTWVNILSLTRNLIDFEYDVVIDYVVYPSDLKWLADQLKDKEINIVYVVLLVDKDTITKRDQLREVSARMGERSLILLQEFEEIMPKDKHRLNTQEYTEEDLDVIIDEILNNKKFIVS